MILADLNPTQLRDWCKAEGIPAFRGEQIFQWIHRGADFPEMSNLPAALRDQLAETAIAQPVWIRLERVSRLDGTVKFLYALPDGNCVEGVLMKYHYGYSLCISTQVGCRMGCRFCASTLDGCVRNLTAGEMLGEVLAANRYLQEHTPAAERPEEEQIFAEKTTHPEEKGRKSSGGEKRELSVRQEPPRVSHVVLMGSGEPLDNYDQVMKFLRLLREPEGIQLSLRNVSLSTCGLVPEMYRLAEENLPVTLCVSLHAPNDGIRRRTMPIANRYSIEEILDACRYYIRKTGRRVIFEYALTDGVNSGEAEARELAVRLRGMQCHVNLIPLNAVKERELKGVTEKTVSRFLRTLEEEHISATRRREMGDDIDGACGQLRRNTLKAENEQTQDQRKEYAEIQDQ